MLYRKNVYAWEQIVRIALGALIAGVPLLMATKMPWLWPVAGISIAMTGVFGFCPACYMVGRRTPGFGTARKT